MFHKKFNKDEVWITSDIHGYHTNICSGTSNWDAGYRNFNNPEEMTNKLISNINKKVPEDHHLIINGDIMFGDKSRLPELVKSIKCKNKYLVFGNHCDYIWKNEEFCRLFNWTGHYLETYFGRQFVCVFHYACHVWRESHRGSWMLYGHSHSSLPDNLNRKSCDIGMDAEYSLFNNQLVMTTNYDLQPIETDDGIIKIDMLQYPDWNKREIIHERFYPFNFGELDEIMSYKSSEKVDHHGSRKNME